MGNANSKQVLIGWIKTLLFAVLVAMLVRLFRSEERRVG